MKLLAIDPGTTESAFLFYDTEMKVPLEWGKVSNLEMYSYLADGDALAYEMVASYGMPVGSTVFETVFEVGRFVEHWSMMVTGPIRRIYRKDVTMHLCGSMRAKDSNIRQSLIDRYGGKDAAIGRKANPGPLYGISKDVWAALGVAVTSAETAEV